MEIIEPNTRIGDDNHKETFDPLYQGDGIMRCVCGYTLYKESESTYRCEGGSHRYLVEEGDVVKDKYGNMLFTIPPSINIPKKD